MSRWMSDDLIRRSDAIGACAYETFECYEARKAIRNLPSADRPQGEWKHLGGDEWLCSECGYVIWTEGSWEHPLERGKDYCEHCGARMFVKDINVPNKKGADDE